MLNSITILLNKQNIVKEILQRTDDLETCVTLNFMGKQKNLEYRIIDQSHYHGEGHIINIAKRHTNRRWRQYTPEKQCLIELELVKTSFVRSIQLKGFGTYIIQINFKDADSAFITQLKFNLNFQEEDIKQSIICDHEVKFVDLKLINNEQNPRRMGINHFFIKGQTIKKPGQQSQQEQEQKKKKKKGAANEIWVRQKIQGQDPWGLNELSNEEDALKKYEDQSLNATKKEVRTKKTMNKQQRKINITGQSSNKSFKRQFLDICLPLQSQAHEVEQIFEPKKKAKPKSQQSEYQKLETSINNPIKQRHQGNQNHLQTKKIKQIAYSQLDKIDCSLLLQPIKQELSIPIIKKRDSSQANQKNEKKNQSQSFLASSALKTLQNVKVKLAARSKNITSECWRADSLSLSKEAETSELIHTQKIEFAGQNESYEQKKQRIKNQLIKKLQLKLNSIVRED